MIVLEALRLIFGSIFVLFLPGLAWSFVFFARKEVDWIERLALSFGISIAMVPLVVFWFNWVFDVKVTLLNTILMVVGLVMVAVVWIWGERRSLWRDIAGAVRLWLRRRMTR